MKIVSLRSFFKLNFETGYFILALLYFLTKKLRQKLGDNQD